MSYYKIMITDALRFVEQQKRVGYSRYKRARLLFLYCLKGIS